MTYLKQVLLISILSLQSTLLASASEEVVDTQPQPTSNKDFIESFLDKPFRLEEELKVTLDGSAKASDLERKSTTQNRLVYIDKENWRALRTRPLQKDSKEFLRSDSHLFQMSSGNQRNRSSQKISDQFWVEIIAAPLHYAREWSFCDSETSLKELISKIKAAEGHALTNAEGDQMSAEFKDDGSILLSAKGKILQDAKTEVQLESIWRFSPMQAATVVDLEKSLLRSHEQK